MNTQLQTVISRIPRVRIRTGEMTRAEQVKLGLGRSIFLFRGAPVAILASALCSAVSVLVALEFADRHVVLVWGAAILLLAGVRLAVWGRYRESMVSGRKLHRFARLHMVFMAFNGMMWGALVVIFAVYGAIGSAFIPFVIAGMTAASIASAGADWRAVMAFNFPALVPLAVVYAISGIADNMAMSGIVILYAVAISFLAFNAQHMIERFIFLSIRNNRLSHALRQHESHAHERKKRFRALVEASSEMTVILSPAGQITYASPSARTVLGIPANVLVGKKSSDIVHPEDIPVFRTAGEKTLSRIGGVMSVPYLRIRAGAESAYVNLCGRLTNMLYVPGVEGFVFTGSAVQE